MYAEWIKLLGPDEPVPVSTYNPEGKSRFLLVADHAGNLIPRALGRLGLIEADCKRHIAWDIGTAGLARLLADQLDANLIKQNYSRLNRLQPSVGCSDFDPQDQRRYTNPRQRRCERVGQGSTDP